MTMYEGWRDCDCDTRIIGPLKARLAEADIEARHLRRRVFKMECALRHIRDQTRDGGASYSGPSLAAIAEEGLS